MHRRWKRAAAAITTTANAFTWRKKCTLCAWHWFQKKKIVTAVCISMLHWVIDKNKHCLPSNTKVYKRESWNHAKFHHYFARAQYALCAPCTSTHTHPLHCIIVKILMKCLKKNLWLQPVVDCLCSILVFFLIFVLNVWSGVIYFISAK